MKKLILLFITIILIIIIFMFYMTLSDKFATNKVLKEIMDSTKIENIGYINMYDNYYIVIDDSYLYVLDNMYRMILEIDKLLLHENINNYSLIYKDKQVMYLNDKYKNSKLTYEYYDIYKYELIDKITVGGA